MSLLHLAIRVPSQSKNVKPLFPEKKKGLHYEMMHARSVGANLLIQSFLFQFYGKYFWGWLTRQRDL